MLLLFNEDHTPMTNSNMGTFQMLCLTLEGGGEGRRVEGVFKNIQK